MKEYVLDVVQVVIQECFRMFLGAILKRAA